MKPVYESSEPRERVTGVPCSKGLRGIQRFRRLRRQHPALEPYQVWALAGYDSTQRAKEAASAPWADGRASPAEARFRNDPR